MTAQTALELDTAEPSIKDRPVVVREIVERALDGESYSTIAEDFEISRTYARIIANDNGVPPRPKHPTGPGSPGWKGGKPSVGRYVWIYAPEHSRDGKSRVQEHVVVAQNILGKLLPPGACVHHVNENKHDNRPCNLVICENEAYHQLLHQRMRAHRACSHAGWLKCRFCKQYDDPSKLYVFPNQNVGHHRSCAAEYARKRREGGGSS